MIQVNLKNLLKTRKMSLTDLSKATGISLNALSTFASGNNKAVQFGTLEKIVEALGIKFDDLFQVVNHVAKLHFVPLNILPDQNSSEGMKVQYNLIAIDVETGQTEELFVSASVLSANTTNRNVHIVTFSNLQVSASRLDVYQVLHSFVSELLLTGGATSTAAKVIGFLTANDLIKNQRLANFSDEDLFVFDYTQQNPLPLVENHWTSTVDEEHPHIIEEIKLVGDRQINDIVFDNEGNFEHLLVQL
ncbi:helix-turn-helix domain-containing protein [Shouchella rhizosphaerae]|uniref:helix-turn-helix domain-containing protein n=1 Tax=Shouchella rhizosphaerae TaxID=866786 RepID=UPI0020404394|nr:helix-turn-helix transcriptional regulator [Shouchella rhizosphaerae]MCM3382131.1 helix-turn-helix transcriptional regulator [Shouchella rhizosphaerae]